MSTLCAPRHLFLCLLPLLIAASVLAQQPPGSGQVSTAPIAPEPDSYVNVTNGSADAICVNAYVFASGYWPNGFQAPTGVCSTLVPAGQTYSASVQNDLLANPLVPVIVGPFATIKLLVSAPSPTLPRCDQATVTREALVPGISASLSPVPGLGGVPFQTLDLNAASGLHWAPSTPEFEALVWIAQLIFWNGSGYGFCHPLQQVQVTPADATRALVAFTESLGLGQAVVTSLTAPLTQTAELLEDDDAANDAAACGQIGAFLNQVEAKRNHGAITAAQAEELTQRAVSIRSQLGC